jgi:hypothetical protein
MLRGDTGETGTSFFEGERNRLCKRECAANGMEQCGENLAVGFGS